MTLRIFQKQTPEEDRFWEKSNHRVAGVAPLIGQEQAETGTEIFTERDVDVGGNIDLLSGPRSHVQVLALAVEPGLPNCAPQAPGGGLAGNDPASFRHHHTPVAQSATLAIGGLTED